MRNEKSVAFSFSFFSQVIYCRGYSGEEPPLPIPNREVKLTIADGTAPPGGRVGSCRSSDSPARKSGRGIFVYMPAAQNKDSSTPRCFAAAPSGASPSTASLSGRPCRSKLLRMLFSLDHRLSSFPSQTLSIVGLLPSRPADGPPPAAAGILVVAALFRRLRRLHPSQCLRRPAPQNSYPSGPSL